MCKSKGKKGNHATCVSFYPCSYTCGMITFFTLALTHVAWLPFLPLLLHMWHDYHISNFYKNDWLHFKYLNTYWSIIEEMKNLLRVINFLCTLILGYLKFCINLWPEGEYDKLSFCQWKYYPKISVQRKFMTRNKFFMKNLLRIINFLCTLILG
jgi:hypothetical protein